MVDGDNYDDDDDDDEGSGLDLGWQCWQMCLSATPLKRQTFLSVADMSEMSSTFCYVGTHTPACT